LCSLLISDSNAILAKAKPPPSTIPSSIAPRVAFIASGEEVGQEIH